MKETGLLLKDRLVRATLRPVNPKTQTRRLVKPQPGKDWRPLGVGLYHPAVVNRRSGELQPGAEVFGAWDEDHGFRCPYGGPGDRLWVREAWQRCGLLNRVHYRATATKPYDTADPRTDEDNCLGKWKPGIHLFRRDARLLLDMKEVRIERLQDITEEDAIAEGVEPDGNGWVGPSRSVKQSGLVMQEAKLYPTARFAFSHLWDSINGEREGASWDSNPWVWVISFERVSA